ncbi:MAG: gamma-glutamyltransferase [Actinomycetota bacterium]|nr:gamma-glutamyltransferase [Actinomycetota bacterium]
MTGPDGRPSATWGIATPHELASRAGADVLEGGGTACDAAVAAAGVLAVVYPHNCSVGGDLVALVARPGEPPRAVLGVGRAAAAVDAATWRGRFGDHVPVGGPASISLPGVVSGWSAMHEIGGTRPFADLLSPAISLASDGFEVGVSLARALAEHDEPDEGIDSVFGPPGSRARLGDGISQKQLARTLEEIAQDPSSYYRGELASRLCTWLASVGSPLGVRDFAEHEAVVAAPLEVACGALAPRLWTPGPPSQGVFVALLARAAGGLLDAGHELLGRDADLLARMFHEVTLERDALLAEPRRVPRALYDAAGDVAAERLASEVLRARAEAGASAREGPPRPPTPRTAASGDTVAVVVLDASGGAVSMLQSVFHSFGSGMLDPASGIVFHNRQAMFTLRAGDPGEIGPGLMPPHTLAPALVTWEDGRRLAALGTMGGRGQPQILTQLLLRIAGGASGAEAVGSPRFVVGELDANGANGVVLAEPGLGRDARDALRRSGLDVRTLPSRDEAVGHAQLVSVGHDGAVSGASDPRSDGAAVVGGPGADDEPRS